MLDVVLVILPVFLLIFLGQVFRRRAFPGEDFWAPAERLVYWVLFPSLLATTLAKADFTGLEIWPMTATVVVAILAMTGLTLALKPLLRIDGPAFTSVHQGTVRMNTYIGLAIAFGLHGTLGLSTAALAVAAIVPLVNVTGVLILTRYGRGASQGRAGLLWQVLRNPLILGCIIGGLLNLTGLGLPPVVGPLLEILTRAALPLGLLCVGAALDLTVARAAGQLALIASGLKLLCLPAFTGIGLWLLGIDGLAAFIAVLFTALPAAPTSYILARQLGGDATLMANLVTLQTLAAIFTLPLVLSFVS
jgi:predicted permease